MTGSFVVDYSYRSDEFVRVFDLTDHRGKQDTEVTQFQVKY